MTGERRIWGKKPCSAESLADTPQIELRRNTNTRGQDSHCPGNDSNRPSDEIYFVFRYTNLLVCNVSWYHYVVRLLMTSVIITGQLARLRSRSTGRNLPGKQQFVDYAKRTFQYAFFEFFCVRKTTAKSGLASSTTEWLPPDRFRFWLKSDDIIRLHYLSPWLEFVINRLRSLWGTRWDRLKSFLALSQNWGKASLGLSIRPSLSSARNNSAMTGRIFVEFYIREFFLIWWENTIFNKIWQE